MLGSLLDGLNHLSFIKVVEREHVGDFIEYDQIISWILKHPLRLSPCALRSRNISLTVLGIPGKSSAHLIKIRVWEMLTSK